MNQMAKKNNSKLIRTGEMTRAAGIEVLATRSMPESLAAEAAVLGSMIVDPNCIDDVIDKLKVDPDPFYRIEHQMIFDALITLYERNKGEGLDGVLLRDELEKRKHLEEVGGVEYIAKIMNSVPSSANVMYYAAIVKDKMLLREIITAAREIMDDVFNGDGEPSEKLDGAEKKIFPVLLF